MPTAKEETKEGITKIKRNLVTLNTPLIIKKMIEEDDEENQIIKINKSYKQILDACLMDRTIKLYEENKESIEGGENIEIEIISLKINSIVFTKSYNSETEQTLYIVNLPEIEDPLYALDPNVPMTTINPLESIDSGAAEEPDPVSPNPSNMSDS